MKKLTQSFKALSDANRLRILKMLEIRPLCVCEITEVLQLATSTVSKHLAILREAGLIQDQKDGKWVNYALNRTTSAGFSTELLALLEHRLLDDQTVHADGDKIRAINRFEICSK